ncbi:MAG: hypothetical protein A2945_02745 [Candidatus Liptonbacteria bacterium RIFCSPLOWO2_01_FULL_52_25]|uniref:Uncharacterized protein n=1 Tax=Candidatus Liptonbacteria bacterium RIFCSPLOWO2_01_FULL_52_25 TaxID=1798650 RepID=A0A1G2CHK0_9BACT|nr:MAG: hypothetical protein A2945_02745 [Candidatus Liptonbacteria bacterium RIFCSPLOWO2_01_FULL_52_25]
MQKKNRKSFAINHKTTIPLVSARSQKCVLLRYKLPHDSFMVNLHRVGDGIQPIVAEFAFYEWVLL